MKTSSTNLEDVESVICSTASTILLCVSGKLVMCTVTGIAHKRPQGDQLDQANPVRNDESGLWQCPFCQKDDFPELSEVPHGYIIITILNQLCYQ